MLKMAKEIETFGDIKIKNFFFYHNKTPIF